MLRVVAEPTGVIELGYAATYASWRGRRWDVPRHVTAGNVESVVVKEEKEIRWLERGRKLIQASPSCI